MTPRPISDIEGYHAHVYYDAESKPAATALRDRIAADFDVVMGRMHDRTVGPHPCWSYQVAFKPELFGRLIPWLALNRGDLVVFVHPETGEVVEDHRDRAVWLGAKLELNLEALT
ncbi:MAG TPA: DOPA 4,5-dioxygenase family protein [Kiloniellaceae bacterium]|nr:DOPA 4,5-dioxygenase family protein [Kiloniellaceae bacterium]